MDRKNFCLLSLLACLVPLSGLADSGLRATGPGDCDEMAVWDYDMGMCMPLAMADMPMKMLMVQGNAFGAQTFEQGPRGLSHFAAPNMEMADLGKSVGDDHYVNLDVMTTFERWTYPSTGYPELMQIGEEQANGTPFLDNQHPHSSPIMGITLSDTISLGEGKDHAKVWFSPRGQSTDGPIAFMHRPTGMVNPDAPLGHHVGQDVGHISSTVIGASLQKGNTTLELSTFHGAEPEPTAVDLPIGAPDSYAARLIHQFTPWFYAMASAAYVGHPELHDPDLSHVWRYSASLYQQAALGNDWQLHHALIYGLITGYDHTTSLSSFGEEFWLRRNAVNFWGRFEALQRSSAELEIPSALADNRARWVGALTLGYTQRIARWTGLELGLGASATKNLLPEEMRPAYGGNPWSGKVFLQAGGVGMWDY